MSSHIPQPGQKISSLSALLSRQSPALLVMASLLLLLLGWTWLAIEWRAHTESIQDEHQERIQNVSQISGQALMATLLTADETLIHFRQIWWRDPELFSAAIEARRAALPDRPPLELSVIDQSGRVIFSTMHQGAIGMDVSDMPHFKAHRDRPGDRMQMHAPMFTRSAKRWMLPVSRPLLHPDSGAFEGVLVQWIPPDFMAGMYGSTRLHENSIFTLVDLDSGQILMRSRTVRPLQAQASTQEDHQTRLLALETQLPPPQKYLPTQTMLTMRQISNSGVDRWPSALDQVERTYAWRKLGSLGLLLMVGEPVSFQDAQVQRELQHQIIAAVMFAALLALAAWSAHRAIKAHRMLAHRTLEQLSMAQEHRLHLERSETELRRLSERLTRAGEDERSRVAHHIHDELGQRLTVLRIGLARLQDRLNDPGHGLPHAPARALLQELSRLRRQTDDCLSEVRRMAESMRPSVLAFGLAPALEALCQEFEPSVLRGCSFFEEGADQLGRSVPPEAATTLYRVTQEALSNAARHAGASSLEVCLQWHPDRIDLDIVDDGCGMPTETDGRAGSEGRRGLGIVGMRERVHSLGGQLRIESQTGAGTRVTASLPLPPRVSTSDSAQKVDIPVAAEAAEGR